MSLPARRYYAVGGPCTDLHTGIPVFDRPYPPPREPAWFDGRTGARRLADVLNAEWEAAELARTGKVFPSRGQDGSV